MSLLKALNLTSPAAIAGAMPAPAAPATSSKGAAGAAKKAKGKPARPPVTTLDFSDDEAEVITIDQAKGNAAFNGETRLVQALNRLRAQAGLFWAEYDRGLANFETSMSFSSDDAAKPEYLKVALNTVGKMAFEAAFEAAKKPLGPYGVVFDGVKSIAEAIGAESDRATDAAGETKIASYIKKIRDGIGPQQAAMLRAFDEAEVWLVEKFQALAKDDLGQGKVLPDGRILGESAGLINKVNEAVKAFTDRMPKAADFTSAFASRFANTPGMSGGRPTSGVPTGKLYFGVSVYVDPTANADQPTWALHGKDESWKLVTKAPKPDRVAQSLADSLGGKKPWELDLDKMVKIRIELEESGTNTYMTGWVLFRSSPDTYEVRSNYGKTWFERAWNNPSVRKVALDNGQLSGGSDY